MNPTTRRSFLQTTAATLLAAPAARAIEPLGRTGKARLQLALAAYSFREFFTGDFPASTLVEVSALAAPEILVEIEAIAQGITIDGVDYRGAEFVEEYGQNDGRANRWYRCVLTEGKNREIRKLFDHFGCVVNRLVRLQYGPFSLGDLHPGDVREVPAAQVKELMDFLIKKGAKL